MLYISSDIHHTINNERIESTGTVPGPATPHHAATALSVGGQGSEMAVRVAGT
jgi:hypothetical protein